MQADAVAGSPTAAKVARETDWSKLHDAITPARVVATSARDGRGLDKLMSAMEVALLACCSKVDCVLPYAQAALLAEVHKVCCSPTSHGVTAFFVSALLIAYCTTRGRVLPFVTLAQAGTIALEEYVDDGTHLIAYVPISLRNRLEKAASIFSGEQPKRRKAPPVVSGSHRRVSREQR